MNIFVKLLINVFNMSLTASLVVAVVMALRMMLKKAPKIYSYALWIIVFLRFLCPFTIQSALSLIPFKENAIRYTGNSNKGISLDTGIRNFDSAANYVIASNDLRPVNAVGMSITEIIMIVLSIIWLAGILAISIFIVTQYVRLKNKLRTATLVTKKAGDNCAVYETDQINSPFLLGLFHPRIYLPVAMDKSELQYVLAHEQMHVKRKDFLIKPICFLAVVLHWFNPLVWFSFYGMIKDMEQSCDEAVIQRADEDIRAQYSTTLLNMSMKQSGLLLPIAFGESNTKSRIKNVLKCKKPAKWIGLLIIMVICVASVTLMTSANGADKNGLDTEKANEIAQANGETTTDSNLQTELVENRTPYIGDNSKDIHLLNALHFPEELEYDHIELQTKDEPYELTVYFNLKEGTDIENIDTTADAILLFATIENMGICRFQVNTTGDSIAIEYDRNDFEKLYGELYPYSEDIESINELLEKIATVSEATYLESCITQAILGFNKNDDVESTFKTESHVVLDTVKSDNSITIYAMVLYSEYGYEDGEFKELAGNHMPTAMTFAIDDAGKYSLTEYWIPKDGSYYVPSIKEKFPASVVEDALDTQKYIKEQQTECDEKADEFINELKSEVEEKKQEFQGLLELEIKN